MVIAPSEPSGTPISADLGGRSRDWMLARAKSIKDNVVVIDDPGLLEVQRRMVRILNLTVNFKLNADAYELYDKSESPGLYIYQSHSIVHFRRKKYGSRMTDHSSRRAQMMSSLPRWGLPSIRGGHGPTVRSTPDGMMSSGSRRGPGNLLTPVATPKSVFR